MKNKTILIIFGFLVLGLFLRSLGLERGFFGDEAITLLSASSKLPDIIPNLIKFDGYPPLTAFLLHFWMRINQNEIFIRYYFILFGVGALFMLYLIAMEYFNRNKPVLLSALFLGAISPLLISLSQYIRSYIDSAFWMLLSVYLFLLIVRNKANKWVWLGYALSGLLSIYTFYFSFIMIFSQFIYMFIFKFKEPGLIKKWLLSQVAVALLFMPWAPYFLRQIFNEKSSSFLHWENFGFKIAGLDLGRYMRNIASLFGFDYLFMVYLEGVKKHFGLPLLFIMAGLAFFSLFFILFYSLKFLRKEFKGSQEEVWFLPFFSLGPIVICWFTFKVTKILPDARYLAAPHAIFLVLLSYFFCTLIYRHKKAGIVLFSSLIFLYILRLPVAVSPVLEVNKALEYLREYGKEGDCVVLPDRLPGIEKLPMPYFNIDKYLYTMDPATSKYFLLPENNWKEIKNSLRPFKRIWLIRFYGNTEIFGGNKIIYDFLKRCGRKEISAREFNGLRLILME